MSALVSDPAPVSTGADAVADLAAAAALVAGDAEASGLAASAGEAVEVDGPLASWLYLHWWSGLGAVSLGAPDRRLLGRFEAARRSAAGIEDGLVVLASGGVRLIGARLGSKAVVERAADAVVGSSRPGCAPRPGDLVNTLAGTGFADPGGGWWWARTDSGTDRAPLDRWYLDVSAEGAPALIAALVALSDATGVGLSAKVPAWAAGFDRRDSCVAYFAREHRAVMEAAAADWAAGLGVLGAGRQPFARPLAPGISTAEDPGGEVSYGQLRCAQVAAAIVRLGGRPASGRRARAVLDAVGIDPDRPEAVRP